MDISDIKISKNKKRAEEDHNQILFVSGKNNILFIEEYAVR